MDSASPYKVQRTDTSHSARSPLPTSTSSSTASSNPFPRQRRQTSSSNTISSYSPSFFYPRAGLLTSPEIRRTPSLSSTAPSPSSPVSPTATRRPPILSRAFGTNCDAILLLGTDPAIKHKISSRVLAGASKRFARILSSSEVARGGETKVYTYPEEDAFAFGVVLRWVHGYGLNFHEGLVGAAGGGGVREKGTTVKGKKKNGREGEVDVGTVYAVLSIVHRWDMYDFFRRKGRGGELLRACAGLFSSGEGYLGDEWTGVMATRVKDTRFLFVAWNLGQTQVVRRILGGMVRTATKAGDSLEGLGPMYFPDGERVVFDQSLENVVDLEEVVDACRREVLMNLSGKFISIMSDLVYPPRGYHCRAQGVGVEEKALCDDTLRRFVVIETERRARAWPVVDEAIGERVVGQFGLRGLIGYSLGYWREYFLDFSIKDVPDDGEGRHIDCNPTRELKGFVRDTIKEFDPVQGVVEQYLETQRARWGI